MNGVPIQGPPRRSHQRLHWWGSSGCACWSARPAARSSRRPRRGWYPVADPAARHAAGLAVRPVWAGALRDDGRRRLAGVAELCRDAAAAPVGWQLAANALWAPAFFALHSPPLALAVGLVLLVLIG